MTSIQVPLTVELVPKTAFWSNVRSNVSRKEWEVCKNFVKARSGSKCEICGGVGSRYPVDCHEVWDYDDWEKVQTLVDLIALCPDCHAVKHLGRTMGTGNGPRAIEHLCKVNGWTPDLAELYCMRVFDVWRERSQHQWLLNIDYLSMLGIEATVKDR